MDELHADVIVVGLGAAGACAAIEAADAGADVLVVERFTGGGTTALSGGVVYAGGGTDQQVAAGISDDVEAMYDYLRLEVGDAVDEATLREFCAGSAESLRWLESNGVPFDASLAPSKTSYPSDRHYLYYSGSESSGGFADVAEPAPRGHRAHGPGTSGSVLYAALDTAMRRRGVRVLPQTRARELVTDASGRVSGLLVDTLRDAPRHVRFRHRMLSAIAAKPGLYQPSLRRAAMREVRRIEAMATRPVRLSASRGVILSGGGFIANRQMARSHAPEYRGGLALGAPGDDGSAIDLGVAAGGSCGRMESVSAWRFITPPTQFISGLIVNRAGRRFLDESRYGAALGKAMITQHDGRAWIFADASLVRDAARSLTEPQQWFQRVQTLYLLAARRFRAATVEAVAVKAGVDPVGLRATVDELAAEVPDRVGRPRKWHRALHRAPFSLIDISIRPDPLYPCPMLTLGGLRVSERTGAVLTSAGDEIPGLFAAGRTAVGICSNSYVSGLSIADAVFSGRRAGVAVAASSTVNELD